MVFVKCGRLKRKSVHKGIFAAALSGLCLRSLQQLASDLLAPELFADEKILDAEPIAKCLSGQSSELLTRLIFQKYADRNALGCLGQRLYSFNISWISWTSRASPSLVILKWPIPDASIIFMHFLHELSFF